ncbi:MAG: phosphotransferase [Syntrophobacterales bacterium]|jgi:aminoglycoside/choline kinase family phosphotransferase
MKPILPHSSLLAHETKARSVNLADARPLAGDGSDRRFFRLPGEPSLVLLYHPQPPGREVTENDSYFLIGRHLKSRGVPVPEIYVYNRPEDWMLLEDVGDLSLSAVVEAAPRDTEILAWYRQALEILVGQQFAGKEGFNPAWCFDTPTVTRPFLLERECRYFLQAFLQGYLGLEVEEADLAPDFERLLAGIRAEASPYFLHRDFQSRNLFVQGERLRVLDFQGGRLGPLGYDLAALLIDPYVDLPPDRQGELVSLYQELLGQHLAFDSEEFREQYERLALCRNLQILGAFGFLTRVKGKPQFSRYIPPAMAGLRRRLAVRPDAFPRLTAIVERITL